MPEFRLERRRPSFDLGELIGRNAEEAKERCEREGFDVQVVDAEKTSAITLEWRSNRIRLFVRRGEDCHQG